MENVVKYDENDVFVQYVTVNIEDIQVGDWVYSYNTLTGAVELKEVTETFFLTSDHINYLTFIDERGNEQVIESTDVHPFWVVTDELDLNRAARSVVVENGITLYHENLESTLNGYWVEAKDLRLGDVVLGANGELTTLTNIVRVEQSGGIAVFNFTVEGNHNYFILEKDYAYGQTSILVHNGKCGSNAKILRGNMEAAGTKFKQGDAHHIVPSGHPKASQAREILKKHGIDVNSADNGVKLSQTQHLSTGLHKHASIWKVTEKLLKADEKGPKAVEKVLQNIAKNILRGKFP